MNKRIKELSSQAEDLVDWGKHGDHDDWSKGHDAWEQKFAELIVRECAGIADAMYHTRVPSGPYILEHFGVEK